MTKDSKSDLREPVPDHVKDHQRAFNGTAFIAEVDGLLQEVAIADDLFVASRASRRVRAECEWFERVIPHGPSVGSFYESVLRSIISEMLPSRLKIGEGFVYDEAKQCASAQLDIIVYRDDETAPYYQRDGFVIVSPTATTAVAEVKKTLSNTKLRQLIRKTVMMNLGSEFNGLHGVRYLHVFAFGAKDSIESTAALICSELDLIFKSFSAKSKAGDSVQFSMRNIVLPRVYFLARDEWISTHLQLDSYGGGNVEVQIIQTTTDNDGLSLFLSRMAGVGQAENSARQRNFLTQPLLGPIRVGKKVETRVMLFQTIPIVEIARQFPNDRERLLAISIGGDRPIAGAVGSHVSIERMRSLDELVEQPSFQWIPFRPNGR